MTSSPFCPSKFPVGSSASKTEGFDIKILTCYASRKKSRFRPSWVLAHFPAPSVLAADDKTERSIRTRCCAMHPVVCWVKNRFAHRGTRFRLRPVRPACPASAAKCFCRFRFFRCHSSGKGDFQIGTIVFAGIRRIRTRIVVHVGRDFHCFIHNVMPPRGAFVLHVLRVIHWLKLQSP